MDNTSGTVFVVHESESGKADFRSDKKDTTANQERLSSYVVKLVNNLKKSDEESVTTTNGEKVKVGSALSSLAFFYERARNLVDYKGDHTLFRNAIERVGKRLLWENPARAMDTKRLAEDLVKELIWARYIKNDTFPKHKIEKISQIYAKYLNILYLIPEQKIIFKQSTKVRDWLLGVASSDVEEIIKPNLVKNQYLVEAVGDWFLDRFEWVDSGLSEEDKAMQVIIAAHRSLYKSDLASVRHFLLKKLYPQWFLIKSEDVQTVLNDVVDVINKIEKEINSLYQIRIFRFVKKQVPPFLILAEILEKEEDAETILLDREELKVKVKSVCERKYKEIRNRISRGITRSIIYIFATKIIFALLVEIPYDLLLEKSIRLVPVLINLTFPPLLMLLLGSMIKKPSVKNTDQVITVVDDFVYGVEGVKDQFSLKEKNKNSFMYKFFVGLYIFLFVSIFGLISYFLIRLHFGILSGGIFFGFLSLVLLFGFRVKHNASELNVVKEDEGAVSNIISILSLPFLNIGLWLSSQLSKINFIILIFDFLVEAPLKNILSILEEWNIFMREKREEIIDVPTQT